MTKQEETKKFISQYLRSRFTTNEMPENECDTEAEFIFQYLHYQGVVLKVDRELPIWTDKSTGIEYVKLNGSWTRLGYVAVEPLVEE